MASYLEEKDSEKMIVAAIDFGTTYSGYAFAFRNDYANDALRIQGNTWNSGSRVGVSLKTPTCALFTPEQKFHSFGFDAEDKYADLAIDDEHHDWYYFRRFKMMLYNNPHISRQSTIEDDKGKHMNALEVFSAIIFYLREHMLRAMHARSISEGVQDDEVHWVLTVPAIWSDQAKQFMREAAKKAGIRSDQLDIALEPEAASIYCKHIPVGKRGQELCQAGEDIAGLEAICPGTKYLVLDAGGGTIDITVQEVQGDGSLHQVYMANGGDWGGTKVDEAYEEFLIELVGPQVWDRFKMENRDSYLDIVREFEIKKRTITPEIDQKITFKVPIALNEVYQDMRGQELRLSVSEGRRGRKMAWIGDKLRVDASEAKKLFETACEAIVEHVERIFEQEDAAGTSIILMVGGFSESPMLRHAVRERFGSRKRIIIPQDAGLSVLKGAVLFGFDTRVISTRVMKHTYGIQVAEKFRQGDPESQKSVVKGIVYCDDKFSNHVARGQSVNIGEATEYHDYVPLTDEQTQLAFKVFTSEGAEPKYCETENCTYIGKMLVDLPMNFPQTDRGVSVRLRFGGTELSVEAYVKKTEQKTNAQFDLLE
ncbi:heat shock 70 kDa protein 12A-like [Mizuhopecten yessoensis]|uniref:Heat shock 70 kDa protein n=1 Tax=Mizuhopecten yessoensis TaxID=6573 RepID=A0A1C9U311_MIZYE|nr:heat shock 70 kDa protein 12A-like [Mizuhopecten yessoensis]XP_021339225.1 heat shock 70 kDa protein 12A-like [Mizuhopecten yessoensis]AOR17384.1 heat shock 70 kDa protein [Mizuhopecten yessoensis]OWF37208.1 Heat shock 70 kDa protein 12B [Mizuhopecten yessoensis]